MIKIKKKKFFHANTNQLTSNPNKGVYPVFPAPTPPRIAQHGREVVIALITGCIIMASVARKHPLLFSHRLPFRLGVRAGPRTHAITVVPPASLTHRVFISVFNQCYAIPTPNLILRCLSTWRRVYCTNKHRYTISSPSDSARITTSAMVTQPQNTVKAVHLTSVSSSSGVISK